jgi:hypothetical protein
MTINDMVIELYEILGKPSFLNPLDPADTSTILPTSDGAIRLIRILSWAQNQVVSWKDGSFTQRFVIWSGSFQKTFLECPKYEMTSEAGSQDNRLIFSPATRALHLDNGVARRFDGMYALVRPVTGTPEAREIMVDDGNDLIVSPPFTVDTDSVTVEIHPIGYELPEKNRLRSVQQVYMQNTGAQLERAPREERFISADPEIGDPTQYFTKGKVLYLNRVPDMSESDYDEGYFLKVVAELMPYPLSEMGIDEEPEIPPQFHWGIILWALGWGHGLMQEETKRAVYQDEFRKFMRETIGELDMQDHLHDGYGVRFS